MDDFYYKKRVVVLGGAGMVGGELVKLLLQAGAYVWVIDDFSRGNRRIEGAHYINGDAGSFWTCSQAFEGAFAAFNLAARVAGVFHNNSHQLEMYSENVRLLTVPVMAAEDAGVKHFLQTSSVCVYSPEHNHPCIEKYGMVGDPTPANAGYAEAKRDGERAILWSNIEHAVIVRPSNITGEHDYFDSTAHVIPALIKKAVHDDVIEVLDAHSVTREFIYSGDVALGMMHALAYGSNKGVYNIGTNAETMVTLGVLADIIRKAVGHPDKKITFRKTSVKGDVDRYSDASRLNHLGWHHKTSIEDAVTRTAEWYIESLR